MDINNIKVGQYVKIIKKHDATPAGGIHKVLQVGNYPTCKFVVVVYPGRGTESFSPDDLAEPTFSDWIAEYVN
jgi:hypothetical protein